MSGNRRIYSDEERKARKASYEKRRRIEQRGKCANCHKKLTAPQIDHVLPVSRGGSNTDDNVQLLCGFCNRRKHAKDPIAFAQEQGRLL
jgi:5-methylcytosine-specific restriction endonuclease McrA